MNKEDISFFYPHSNPNASLPNFSNKNFPSNFYENPHLQKDQQHLPRKRLPNQHEHKAGTAASYDGKKYDRPVLKSSEVGYRQSFILERSDSAQRPPQSATSSHSQRRVKVRNGSGSSKIPAGADWSSGMQGGVPLIPLPKDDDDSLIVRDNEAKDVQGGPSCNSTAGFGHLKLRKNSQKMNGLVNNEKQREMVCHTQENNKDESSPVGPFQMYSDIKAKKKSPQEEEVEENYGRNKFMEFTLSGFSTEAAKMNQVKPRESCTSVGKQRPQLGKPLNSSRLQSSDKENAYSIVEPRKGIVRNKQGLVLDLKKARTEEMRGSGMHSNREDRDKVRWEYEQRNLEREIIPGLRKNYVGFSGQNEATSGNKSMEASQDNGTGLSRRELNKNTPSNEYGKSSSSRFSLNFKKSNSEYAAHDDVSPGVKKLVQENSHLRKENSQKEELIGILLTALKHKDGNPNQPDLSPVNLPNLDSYLSPKERSQRFTFSRAGLTSAEKPFPSGTPSQYLQKPFGISGPQRDGLSEIVAGGERGKSNEAMRLFENASTPMKPIVIPSSKPQLISIVDHSRHTHSVTELLSAKRIYSSPLPVPPEVQRNTSAVKNNLGHYPIGSLKGNLANNARMLINYPSTVEAKNEPEMLPKLSLYEHDYGFQRRKSRDTDHKLKSVIPEIKVSSVTNLDALGPPRSKDPTPLNGPLNSSEFIYATFQSKNFRLKSPLQNEKIKSHSQQKIEQDIKSRDELKHQSTSDIDAKTVLSSRREPEVPGLRVSNGLKEVRSYGNIPKEVMYKDSENRVEAGGRDGQKGDSEKKGKFPKEVFTMNIRRKFFC